MSNLKLAKRAAALKLCEMLHKCGELDDHLLPIRRHVEIQDVQYLFTHYPEVKEPSAGTNKKRRLYNKQVLTHNSLRKSNKRFHNHFYSTRVI